MTDLKPIYLMAGGRGGRNTDPIIKAVFEDTAKTIPTIAYVGVASGDNWAFYQMIGAMIRKAGKCHMERVIIAPPKADLNKAKSILQSADAVFMSGGDVEAGMKILEEKNMTGIFQELYQQGRVMFGASAGSIMLAKEWVRWTDPEDDSSAELFPCLGIAPVICDTHAEEDDWEELKAALELKEDGATGYGIPSIASLKVHPDGKLEAMGGMIARYMKQGNRVVKLDDLK